MTDLYSEWRDFYTEKVRSWMSLEELRAECGKLQTVDSPSPEVLLVHAMHALDQETSRGGRQSLTDEHKAILNECRNQAMRWTLVARIPECGIFGGIAQDLDYLCEQLGVKDE